MFKPIAAVGGIIILLLVAFFVFRGDKEASAEERYDGVHLCSPSQQAAATAEAGSKPSSGSSLRTGAGDTPPFFAQNSTTWGNEEYDHGASEDIGCGHTIAECGCAMTSVATVMELFQVMTTPDGTDLNPSTLNAWFNQGAKLTGSGWVSQGYSYGNVVWTAINGWTPSLVQGGEGASAVAVSTERDIPESKPQSIRFKGWGTGSEAEIRSELQAGRPVVLEVPGHYIAAVALEDNVIKINDPAYADRTTLDSYAGRVKSARLFEPSSDMRSLLITVPANMRVELKDSRGRKVGTLGGKDPAAAEADAAAEIPGAVYHFEEAWRDPTCTERAPPPGSGTASIFIPLPDKGIYTVEVIDPSGKDTSAAVYVSDVNGVHKTETHEGGGKITFEINYDPGKADTVTVPTPTPTTTATGTPTQVPPTTRPGTTPIPPTVTPTPTLTPIPLNIVSFTVSLDEVNQATPCSITVSWEVTGPSDTKVFLYRAAGDTVATTDANRIFEGKVGKGSYTEPFSVGMRSYRLSANSSTGSALKAPVTVSPICINNFTVYENDCTLFGNWTIQGNTPARWILFRRLKGTTAWTQVSSMPVTYGTQTNYFSSLSGLTYKATYEFILQVAVASRTPTTDPVEFLNPCD